MRVEGGVGAPEAEEELGGPVVVVRHAVPIASVFKQDDGEGVYLQLLRIVREPRYAVNPIRTSSE